MAYIKGEHRKWVHDPFSLTLDDNTRVTCSETGILTFKQFTMENGEEVEDIVKVTAASIVRLNQSLTGSRRSVLIKENEKE